VPQGLLSKKSDLSQYSVLRDRVREALLLGQQKIEQAKVETYWQTGKLLHEHILHFKERVDYGSQVIQKLAKDLGLGDTLLYRTLRFYQAFPISAGRPKSYSGKLSWTHYRELMKVEDEGARFSFLERAAKSGWSGEQLADKIRLELRSHLTAAGSGKAETTEPASKLMPKLGELYTYRLVKPLSAQSTGDSTLQIDLGFSTQRYLPVKEKGFREGQIVETVKDEEGNYTLKVSRRTEAVLWTYKAIVERVVDGDTMIVRIDLGFDIEERHYLRLRGIDCPELTEAGGPIPEKTGRRSSRDSTSTLSAGTIPEKTGRRSSRDSTSTLSAGTIPEKTGQRSSRDSTSTLSAGKKAKTFVEKQIEKIPFVILTSTRSDKYGRYLADIFIPPAGTVILNNVKDLAFLNQRLLDEGLAGKV